MAGKQIRPERLKKMELFAGVKDKTLEQICANTMLKRYPKGSHPFVDREPLDRVFIVFSGKFNLYKISTAGHKRVIFMLGEGHILNDHLTSGLPCAINCESFEESQALVLPKETFLQLMAGDSTLMGNVLNQYTLKLRRTYRQLKNAPTNVAIEKKIAAKIYALSRQYGVKKDGQLLIDVPLTVTHLSEMLGAQRETVSRSMKKLVGDGLVTYEQKRIGIPNLELLVAFYKKEK